MPTAVFAAVTGIAVLNGTRLLVDAGRTMSPEVAEQALCAYVSRASSSRAIGRAAVAAAGGWLGCVAALYGRMRAKALAFAHDDAPVSATVAHTLIEAARVLTRAGIALPSDASLAEQVAWIINHNRS